MHISVPMRAGTLREVCERNKPHTTPASASILAGITRDTLKTLAREDGIEVVERMSLLVNRNPFNDHYLNTKAAKLGHLMSAPDTENF